MTTRDTLQSFEQNSQEMIAMLSHDLRSPLASIGLTFELVLAGTFGQVPDKCAVRLGQAQNCVGWLISLVNNLLDLDRLESGATNMTMELFDADDLIESALEYVGASAEVRNVEVRFVPRGLSLLGDRDHLLRVVINLLSNAIKFSPNGGAIEVETKEESDGTVVVSIADQGPGIEIGHQSVIFDRYRQVCCEDYLTKGTGLGLAICKAVISQHGGMLGVDSEVGSGSTFWFSIPGTQFSQLPLNCISLEKHSEAKLLRHDNRVLAEKLA